MFGGANEFAAQRAALGSLAQINFAMHKVPESDTIHWKFKSIKYGSIYELSTPWITVRNDACFGEVRPLMRLPKIGMPTTPEETEKESGFMLDSDPFSQPPVRQMNIKDYWKLAINPRHVFSKSKKANLNTINNTPEPCNFFLIFRSNERRS